MTPAARYAAAITVLDQIIAGAAVERSLLNWSRGSRFAGSKDRRAVRDIVFDILRRWRSTAAYGGGPEARARIIGLLRQHDISLESVFNEAKYAPEPLTPQERYALPDAAALSQLDQDIQLDVPHWLYSTLCEDLGQDFETAMQASRHRAPVHLRVNIARMDRKEAIALLAADDIVAQPHDLTDTALTVCEGSQKIAQSTAYLNGYVELQDAASQAVSDFAQPQQGESILDFCAGGGGKILALAARQGGGGARRVAYDANPRRMTDLPARANRAGVDVDICTSLKAIPPESFDLVFVDAPCSGTGTWARQPAAKWSLTEQGLQELLHVQSEILSHASQYVKPGGRLVYTTCSVLKCESEEQVASYQKGGHALSVSDALRLNTSQVHDGLVSHKLLK